MSSIFEVQKENVFVNLESYTQQKYLQKNESKMKTFFQIYES